MYKVNIYTFEIGKSDMRLKHTALKTIYARGILTINNLRSPTVEMCFGHYML